MFDQELIAQVVAAGMRRRIGEIAVPTRYFEEASSVGFRRSVVYGLVDRCAWSPATCSIDAVAAVIRS